MNSFVSQLFYSNDLANRKSRTQNEAANMHQHEWQPGISYFVVLRNRSECKTKVARMVYDNLCRMYRTPGYHQLFLLVERVDEVASNARNRKTGFWIATEKTSTSSHPHINHTIQKWNNPPACSVPCLPFCITSPSISVCTNKVRVCRGIERRNA